MFIITGDSGYYRKYEEPKDLCFYYRHKDGSKISLPEAENLENGAVLYVRRKDPRFFLLPVYDKNENLIREETNAAQWIHYDPVLVTITEKA